ncbi:unnamed protein product [Cylicocyclus nassatus]|uniref:Uncharacterized protein n=1 Tax=Cylicocyclus nassatus TaxID=53992 RepID=A0AA36M6Q0_CYLNA|nr:unnamed protein product [Cylicocyclus nassatus]
MSERVRKRRSEPPDERLQLLRKSAHSKDHERSQEQSSDPYTATESTRTINATCVSEEATSSQNLTQTNLMECSSERRITTSLCSDENKEIRHGPISNMLGADEEGDASGASTPQVVNMPLGKSSEVTRGSRTPLHDMGVCWNDTNNENCNFPIIQNLEPNVYERELAATLGEDESEGYISGRLLPNDTIISQQAENQVR